MWFQMCMMFSLINSDLLPLRSFNFTFKVYFLNNFKISIFNILFLKNCRLNTVCVNESNKCKWCSLQSQMTSSYTSLDVRSQGMQG